MKPSELAAELAELEARRLEDFENEHSFFRGTQEEESMGRLCARNAPSIILALRHHEALMNVVRAATCICSHKDFKPPCGTCRTRKKLLATIEKETA